MMWLHVTRVKVVKASTISGEKRKKGDIVDVVPSKIEKLKANGLVDDVIDDGAIEYSPDKPFGDKDDIESVE